MLYNTYSHEFINIYIYKLTKLDIKTRRIEESRRPRAPYALEECTFSRVHVSDGREITLAARNTRRRRRRLRLTRWRDDYLVSGYVCFVLRICERDASKEGTIEDEEEAG